MRAVLLGGLASAAACAAVPENRTVRQDVEFLRGCWVSKTEPGGGVTGFLRLLPDRQDGATYAGVVQTVSGAMVRDRFRLSFARDGSRVTVGYPDGGLGVFAAIAVSASNRPQAVFEDSSGDDSGARLVVEAGPGDTLIISRTGGRQHAGDLFRGERDGCD